MSRTLKRPMFRRGGQVNDGIMTGLTDRKQLASGTGLDVDRARLESTAIKNIMDELAPIPKTRLPIGQLGLNLASGKFAGDGFLQNLIGSAQAPYASFVKADDARKLALAKRNQAAVSTALASQLGKGKDAKTFKDIVVAKELEKIIPQIYDLEAKIKGGTASKEDKIQLEILKTQKSNFTKTNPVTAGSIDLFVKSSQGQNIFSEISQRLFRQDKIDDTKKYKTESDTTLYIDTIEEIKKLLGQFSSGGRVGYANGMMVTDKTKPSAEEAITQQQIDFKSNPISYDQLRARLPKEITNDIIRLIAVSTEALEDFANIANQKDIDNFNKKYSVNLVLPSEA